MRRLNLALLAAFQLCRARTAGFSIHDDLVAFPQFDVVFTDGFVSDKDAEALLESRPPDFYKPAADDTRETDNAERDQGPDGPPGPHAHTYEMLNMPPHRYLCSIPVVQPRGPENQTANELAKAQEARELSRAAVKGWELLTQLQDSCLYFMSGWWSYSFCNNREIVQFHAMAAVTNGQPPKREPHTAEYVLGRVPSIPATAAQPTPPGFDEPAPLPAELQVKGDQRYLVQRLEGGTICDLTGRERTIEVQYHCVPGLKDDRIGWIKEVTICAYVMVVNTPRLCNDVAFLPPEETKANPISCRRIADGDEATRPLLDQSLPVKDDASDVGEQEETSEGGEEAEEEADVTIGGVVVGARKVLSSADEDGKPPVKLAPPRRFWPNKGRSIEVLVQAAAKNKGGKVDMPSADELKEMGISPDVVEEMRKKMEKLAGDAGWKLEVVELNGGDMRELRGSVDGEGKAVQGDGSDGDGGDGGDGDGDGGDGDGDDENEATETAGSEEKFFKEEL